MNNFDLYRRATLLADSESAYQLAKRVVGLEKALQEAVWRLEDMLEGDDGQAWKEAEKALPKIREAMLKAVYQ